MTSLCTPDCSMLQKTPHEHYKKEALPHLKSGVHLHEVKVLVSIQYKLHGTWKCNSVKIKTENFFHCFP